MSPARGLLPERPLVDEERGRDAERDGVGQRVDLQAEGALRLGQPRDAPVEHVEEQREDEQQRRPVVVVVALRGRADADGVEPAEHARERDDVRKRNSVLRRSSLRAGRQRFGDLRVRGDGSCPQNQARVKQAADDMRREIGPGLRADRTLGRPPMSALGPPAMVCPKALDARAPACAGPAPERPCRASSVARWRAAGWPAAPKSGSSTRCEPKSTESRRAATATSRGDASPPRPTSDAAEAAADGAAVPPDGHGPSRAAQDAVTLGAAARTSRPTTTPTPRTRTPRPTIRVFGSPRARRAAAGAATISVEQTPADDGADPQRARARSIPTRSPPTTPRSRS